LDALTEDMDSVIMEEVVQSTGVIQAQQTPILVKTARENAAAYYATGEHPNLADC
jgi:hypothetical protein